MACTEDELLERKALLQQQLAIVNDRFAKSSTMMAKKRFVRKCEREANADAKRKELREQRQREIAAARHAALSPPVAGASATPLGGDAERLRMEHVMRRAVRKMSGETASGRTRFRVQPTGVFHKQQVVPTIFSTRYVRGELPCVIEHRGSRNGLTWLCPLLDLDYEYYLPIFFDGLRCAEEPYSSVARQGVFELLQEAQGHPDCVMPCLPKLVRPLRLALLTKDPDVVMAALRALQHLVNSNHGVGEALVPHYRQLLAVLNLFFSKRRNTGDVWTDTTDIGTAVLDTLELLELTGGPDAFINIKRMVPTYESIGN